MNIRNARWAANGMIECEYEHPKYGLIPFAASPDDVEETGREIFAQAAAGSVLPAIGPSKEEADAKARQIKNVADKEAAKSDPKLQAFTDMSPDDVRAWVSKNVKSESDVSDVLATLAVAVSVLSRSL